MLRNIFAIKISFMVTAGRVLFYSSMNSLNKRFNCFVVCVHLPISNTRSMHVLERYSMYLEDMGFFGNWG